MFLGAIRTAFHRDELQGFLSCVCFCVYTVLATRPRAAQLQQAEPAAPPSSQQPAQTTQAQTQQQIQNGTPILFISTTFERI